MKTKIDVVPSEGHKKYTLRIVTTEGKKNIAQITTPLEVGDKCGEILNCIYFGVDFTRKTMLESLKRKRVRRGKTFFGKIINLLVK